MYPLALIGSLIVGIVLLVFVRAKEITGEYILVIQCGDDSAEKKAADIVKADTKRSVLKTKTVARGYIEVTYEITLKKDSTEFVNKLSGTDGIEKAVLVSYNGDYMS